jgi:hypothetical protein
MKRLTQKQQNELFKYLVDALEDAVELTRKPYGKTTEEVTQCVHYNQGRKDILREVIAFVKGA